MLWQLLIRYLFRLLSINELLFRFHSPRRSVAHTKLSTTSFCVVLSLIADHLGEHMRERTKKKSLAKLPISELLSKKHLSTVINNRTEPLVLSVHLLHLWLFLFAKAFALFQSSEMDWSLPLTLLFAWQVSQLIILIGWAVPRKPLIAKYVVRCCWKL